MVRWALSCQRKADGQPAQAIEEAKEQLFVHAEGLEQGLTKNQVQGKGSALAGLLGVFVPPVGWAVTAQDSLDLLYETGKGFFEARRRQARLESDRVGRRRAGRPVGAGRGSGGVAGPAQHRPAPLPLVVVVDDAHCAAPSIVASVDRLLAHSTARALVVATAWPDQLAVQA